MDPIAYRGDLAAAHQRLLTVLADQPRVEITERSENLIRAVFTTRMLRFKDDVVFLFDPEQRLIHFRSASRIGRSDWGANRERMQRIAELYAKAQPEDKAR